MTVRNGIGFPGTWRRVAAAVISLTKQYLSEGKTSAWYHYMSRPEFVEGEADMRAIQWAKAAGAAISIPLPRITARSGSVNH